MNLTRYTIEKGSHAAKPRVFRLGWRTKIRGWNVIFEDSCRYNLGPWTDSSDQKDFNKLVGLSFNLFTNHKESAMIGWRYNPESDLIELAPYYHIDGQVKINPGFTDENLFYAVRIGEEIQVSIGVDYEQKLYYTRVIGIDYEKTVQMGFSHNSCITREINVWFGGNQPAPQDITVLKKGSIQIKNFT